MKDSELRAKLLARGVAIPPTLTDDERAALERAAEIRARKRDARERRRAEGAPPPEGGPTGRICKVVMLPEVP